MNKYLVTVIGADHVSSIRIKRYYMVPLIWGLHLFPPDSLEFLQLLMSLIFIKGTNYLDSNWYPSFIDK